MTKGTTDTYIDLVEWVQNRYPFATRRQAETLILAGCVRSESHKLGIQYEKDGRQIFQPKVPSHLRDTIYFVPPETHPAED